MWEFDQGFSLLDKCPAATSVIRSFITHPHDPDLAFASTDRFVVAFSLTSPQEFFRILGTEEGPNATRFWQPHGLAIDGATQSLLVADPKAQLVHEIEIRNHPVPSNTWHFRKVGSIGPGWGCGPSADRFSYPCAVAVHPSVVHQTSDRTTFVLDSGLNRIVLFDGRCRPLWRMNYGMSLSFKDRNSFGQHMRLHSPSSLIFDVKARTLLICDTANHRIVECTHSGGLISQFGSKGVHRGQFIFPTGLALCPMSNRILVLDSTDRIQIFSRDGTSLFVLTALQSASLAGTQPRFTLNTSADSLLIVDGSLSIQIWKRVAPSNLIQLCAGVILSRPLDLALLPPAVLEVLRRWVDCTRFPGREAHLSALLGPLPVASLETVTLTVLSSELAPLISEDDRPHRSGPRIRGFALEPGDLRETYPPPPPRSRFLSAGVPGVA